MKKVAILGCGPAGLLAAHAAQLMHIDFQVFAFKQPSIISGAQFLHSEIPHLTEGEGNPINVRKLGTREGYAKKVYGSEDAPCSFDLLKEGVLMSWPMMSTYETLWGLYEDAIKDIRIYPADILPLLSTHDAVLSTIPRSSLCARPKGVHQFKSQQVFFRKSLSMPIYDVTDGNFINYDGRESVPYYRMSRLFGHSSTEYSGATCSVEDIKGLDMGTKPLSHNCNCHPEIIYLGRFGKWEKGVLVHHAFREACDALHRL